MILEKASSYFVQSSEVPTALGILACREGQLEQAFDHFREAISRNKKDPRPYRWMLLIAKKKGDHEGVKRYEREYQRILKKSVD
jgi:Flp pilus assembly protein TadD